MIENTFRKPSTSSKKQLSSWAKINTGGHRVFLFIYVELFPGSYKVFIQLNKQWLKQRSLTYQL